MKGLCVRWAPHKLSEKEKILMKICQENLNKLESSQWRLSDIVTADETWIYHRTID